MRASLTGDMHTQVLEDGRLTDSEGRVVSFKDTLIVLTSNVGSRALSHAGGASVGFAVGDEAAAVELQQERQRSRVHDELKAVFRPEFLNRLDDIVVRSLPSLPLPAARLQPLEGCWSTGSHTPGL